MCYCVTTSAIFPLNVIPNTRVWLHVTHSRRRVRRWGRRRKEGNYQNKWGMAETPLKISKEVDPSHVSETLHFVKVMGAGVPVPSNCNTHGFFNAFLRSFIKVDQIQRGRISCTVIAKPPLCVSLTNISLLNGYFN